MSNDVSYSITEHGSHTELGFTYDESQEEGEDVAQLFFEVFDRLDDEQTSVYRKDNTVYLEGYEGEPEKIVEEYIGDIEEEVNEIVNKK